MAEWHYAQQHPTDQLCQLHHFAMKKKTPSGDVEFVITVKEYLHPPDPAMRFYATADKQTNQTVAAYTPCGWGSTLLVALSECIKSVHKFPYQPVA